VNCGETRTIGTNVAVDDSGVKGKPSALTIGARPDEAHAFHGQIDDIAVWHSVRFPTANWPGFSKNRSDSSPSGETGEVRTGCSARVFSTMPRRRSPNASRGSIAVCRSSASNSRKPIPALPALPRRRGSGDNWNPIAFFHEGRHRLFLANTLGGYQNAFKDYSDPIILQHLVSGGSDPLGDPAIARDAPWTAGQFESGTFFVNEARARSYFLFCASTDRATFPTWPSGRDDELRDRQLQPDAVAVDGAAPRPAQTALPVRRVEARRHPGS